MSRFDTPIAEQIWDMKYRFKEADGTPIDGSVEDSWRRIARALAEVETDPAKWEAEFYAALEGFQFLPAGRITAGAGTGRSVTLFNCFVMGTIPDTMGGIFDGLKEAALTMQQGGGIGYDFSTIRPKGAEVKGVAADASGPLSFMDVWDAMCRTIMSAGSRRGAMMATMRCDHPDIEAFIEAKKDPARLRMFNLSVLVTDPFMAAVKADGPWELVFGGRVYQTVSGARSVEPDHALDLRLCRAGGDLHRPDQCGEQPWLCRDDRRDQPLRRAALAALWRLSAGVDQPADAGDGRRSTPQAPAGHGRAGPSGARGRADDGQRGRCQPLSPAANRQAEAQGQAADRAGGHRAGRCAC